MEKLIPYEDLLGSIYDIEKEECNTTKGTKTRLGKRLLSTNAHSQLKQKRKVDYDKAQNWTHENHSRIPPMQNKTNNLHLVQPGNMHIR